MHRCHLATFDAARVRLPYGVNLFAFLRISISLKAEFALRTIAYIFLKTGGGKSKKGVLEQL